MFTEPHIITSQTLSTYTLASNLQKSIHDERGRVVGPDRLPTIQDKPDLHYITAIARECLRWRSVAPLNIPHVTAQEDECRDYRIPAGSVVIANLW